MEQLQSLEQYKEVLKQEKAIYRGGYSNNFLNVNDIKRYLDLGRIYFEVNEGGLLFFTDEGEYYRLFLQIGIGKRLKVRKAEKPILVRTVYKSDAKPVELKRVEENLRNNGFLIYDESVQILAKPFAREAEIRKKQMQSERFLNRMQIKIDRAKPEHLDEILQLRNSTPELKPYHFLYETVEEMIQDIEKGYYRCAFNEKNEICGVQQFNVVNGAIQGNWLAIKEEYKTRYGIGNAMAFTSFVYALDCGIENYFGWVVRTNEKSIQYHKTIGYEITDKHADEWLLA